MKRCVLMSAVLLCSTAFSYAASPDVLWQDYQKHPGYVSNMPTKPAAAPTPHVTVEAQDGSTAEPTTPEQAKEKAEVQAAEAEATSDPEQTANAETTNATTQATDAGDPSVFDEAPAAQPAKKAAAVIVGNKPVAPANKPKPKPKLNLVGKPPLPRQFMRTPQASDFVAVTSTSGGYSIALPSAFGTDPLASLPQTEGAMLVRTASDTLMCAVTMLDAADVTSYSSTQALPQYENKKVYWQWQHDAALTWSCTLSAHNDYHGDKILFEAQTEQTGKTYQMLFVMPANRYTDLLPQAVYALNSFKLN